MYLYHYHIFLYKLNNTIIHSASPLSIPHEIALNSLFDQISKHTKVVISGEGADEMFGGYGRVQSSGFDYEKIKFVKKFVPKNLQSSILKLFGSNEEFDWNKYQTQMDHFFDTHSHPYCHHILQRVNTDPLFYNTLFPVDHFYVQILEFHPLYLVEE